MDNCELCRHAPQAWHVHAQWTMFDFLDFWVCDDCAREFDKRCRRALIDGASVQEIIWSRLVVAEGSGV